MTDAVEKLALSWKLVRVATFRQLQALSNALLNLNGMSLNSFLAPAQAIVRPVGPNERRVVVDIDGPSLSLRCSVSIRANA
jgi:hypothetical protein